MEQLLTSSGAGSYLKGSACHLDLVQWATVQPQGQLPAAAWQRLVAEDREFLRWQLAHANVSLVLINGTSVIDGLLAAGVVSDLAEDRLEYPAKEGTGYLRVFRCASERGPVPRLEPDPRWPTARPGQACPGRVGRRSPPAPGGAGNLPWHLAPNASGNRNRMSYLPDDNPTPGWYAYTRHPDTAQP